MSCDRHTDAIIDHACGAEIADDAAAHLAGCADCHRLFDEQRRMVRALDEELQLALAIEPSARFVPDVLARVERSRPSWRGFVSWAIPVAAAAALLLVTLATLRPGSERQ